MVDQPDGPQLLALAREKLLETLLPGLSGDQRYLALMIANAMAIAGRESAAGPSANRDLGSALAGLRAPLSEEADPDRTARLVAEIRAGRFDEDREAHNLLLAEVCDRLAISNPKHLAFLSKSAG